MATTNNLAYVALYEGGYLGSPVEIRRPEGEPDNILCDMLVVHTDPKRPSRHLHAARVHLHKFVSGPHRGRWTAAVTQHGTSGPPPTLAKACSFQDALIVAETYMTTDSALKKNQGCITVQEGR